MKIIIVEKLYYPYSGPQDYFFDLVHLLRQKGHDVIAFDGYRCINVDAFDKYSINTSLPEKNLTFGINALYSIKARNIFSQLLRKERPDIVHINNIYHNISPSILYEAKKLNIPIVYHLHDYKLVCPIHTIYQSGKICMACKNGNYFQVIANRCTLHDRYKFMENIFLYVESMLHNRILHVHDNVDAFITPSTYVKKAYEEMGFKGHMVNIPCFTFPPKRLIVQKKRILVYTGHIMVEKGIKTLLQAIEGLSVELRIIGQGSKFSYFQSEVKKKNLRNIKFLGFLSGKELERQVGGAFIVIVPSLYPDAAPKTIIESFALGNCVIGSDIGGISEMIVHGVNGFLFQPGDAEGLRRVIKRILHLSQKKYMQVRMNAYKTWEERYSPDVHYRQLMQLYASLL